MIRRSVAERLLARSVVDPTTGCRRWTGCRVRGYGQIYVDGKLRRTHRLAYQIWVGPIPNGLVIDHVAARGCAYTDCINPTHLEAVTQRENVLRGISVPAQNALKTSCPRGHPYPIGPRKRGCLTCRKSKKKCGECSAWISYQNVARHVRSMHRTQED